jgi:hypothetical protein
MFSFISLLQLGSQGIYWFKQYYKPILIFLSIVTLIGYIWFLRSSLEQAKETILQNQKEFQDERVQSIMKAKEQELKYINLEYKYGVEVLNQKLIIKERIKTEVKVLKGEDHNNTLVMDANCSKCIKGRYNENNSINRAI